MRIDLERITNVVDSARLAASGVAFVGCGGSHHLATSLARCGVGRFVLIDGDRVEPANLCRADFRPDDIGAFKVRALGQQLELLGADVDDIPEPFAVRHWERLREIALIVAATDSLAGQAAVNRFALARSVPALFVGLAAEGLGGEIVFWRPGLPCYRCLVGQRYLRHETDPAAATVSSRGVTLFDVTWVDAIAGQLALGLLQRDTPTRFGRLLESLGDRNYLRLKIDPTYRLAGSDVVRRELGIPENNEQFTGWCVSAQRDPTRGQPPCPDCLAAGHTALDESLGLSSSVPPFSPGR